MIRTAVIGSAGRMGKLIVKNILNSQTLILSAALETKNSNKLGIDAGILANGIDCGIFITDNLDDALQKSDVIIDFSTGPTIQNVKNAIKNGVAVVIGTTGLTPKEKSELQKLALAGGKIVCSPNMSVGVNLLFHLAKETASTLGDEYEIEVTEIHHNQKKDSPSGTAEKLVEILAEASNINLETEIAHGRKGLVGVRPKKEIGVHAIRGGDVVGEHTVYFFANGERIELTHKASSRETFAMGALRAANFIYHAKPGYYDMQDVLNLKNKI